MLVQLSPQQQKNIVRNVLAACNDITKLNKTGYNFLYLASGFIAHYDINGFIHHYSHISLVDDILCNEHSNMWYNFRQGERDYEYYMSKRAVYQAICEKLRG